MRRKHSFSGEEWTVEGRSIVTPDGHFYLTYGSDEKTSAPHYRDFCKLDRIARAMPLLARLEVWEEWLSNELVASRGTKVEREILADIRRVLDAA